MTRLAVLLVAVLIGCSDFTTTEGGIARLDVLVPVPAEVEVAQTIQLRGVARDENGDTLDVPVYWRALDTTISVDSVQGLLTGRTAGSTGRVVARAVDLYSSPITFSVLRRADTLIALSDSTLVVASGVVASPELKVQVAVGDSLDPVQGRRITFEVISPVFATLDDRTVEFAGGKLTTTQQSGSTGEPSQSVTLNRRAGRTQPDTAIVQVSVYRPDGGTVPGSGLRFYVLFQP
jgi:hypothetical protein